MASVITDKEKLNAGMEATADAIREKTGESAPIPWDYEGETGFAAAVAAIPAGREPVIDPITITENGIYTVPAGVDGYGPIIVGVAVRSPRCDQVVTFDWGAEQQYMAWMDGTPEPRPEPEPPTPPTPPTPAQNVWVNGTDAEVAAVLDAAAAGTIDLQQDAGWSVGDVRTITVGAWTGGGNTAHAAQDVNIVITSFEEYMGCGNVMQFDFYSCPANLQRMNDTRSSVGGYGVTEMYTTTLPALVEALPTWLKARLKTFSVLASEGGNDPQTILTVTGNKLALRSAVEVCGLTEFVTPGEGEQLPYYQTVANRKKQYTTSITNPIWWTRTSGGAFGFRGILNDDPSITTTSYSDSQNLLAPFGCL